MYKHKKQQQKKRTVIHFLHQLYTFNQFIICRFRGKYAFTYIPLPDGFIRHRIGIYVTSEVHIVPFFDVRDAQPLSQLYADGRLI